MYNTLRVFADFMLFDHLTDKLNYQRFKECFKLLCGSEKFSNKKLFVELCGKNKKYLTFLRLLDAFRKSQTPEGSTELKNFFAHLKLIFRVILNLT